ncbi:MAG: hypothetical protein U5J78_06745 [Parasphingorhabdus sp.]|nr:hypothetical protein [Parasphingorhabdus sp.]
MISLFVELFPNIWSPLRLLNSYFFLAGGGALFTAFLAWTLLPRYAHRLTTDKGRAHAINADQSIGKPLGVGLIMVIIIAICCVLFIPPHPRIYVLLVILLLASLIGYGDDKSGGYSEMALGLWDLFLAAAAAVTILGVDPVQMWVPIWSQIFVLPFWVSIPLFTGVIWLSINALNCNDGVDGLSGSLSLVSIAAIGLLHYSVLGNVFQAEYLLIPFNELGAVWSIMCAVFAGALAGYLWHNAPPSAMLMGDAGSRPVGLFLGMMVTASLNPFLIVVIGALILANGATGLMKLLLLRLFKLNIFSKIRFPLHDHARKNLDWSNSQVLVRFVLLHLAITAALLLVILKVR